MTQAPPASASYDALAEQYDALYSDAHDQAENRWLSRMLAEAGVFAADKTLLDVGCGTGLTLALAANASHELSSAHYTGIDPSYGMLRVARRHWPGYRFRPGSAEISDSFGRFDVVTALFGPYNYARFPRGLMALNKTLGVNARAALVVYGPRYPKHPKYERVETPFVTHMRLWTRDQLWNALRLSTPRLKDVTIHGFSTPDFYARTADLGPHVDAPTGDACFLLAVGKTGAV